MNQIRANRLVILLIIGKLCFQKILAFLLEFTPYFPTEKK